MNAKSLIKYNLKIWWSYVEILFTKIQRLFNVRKDSSVIPPGPYCYVIDEEKNDLEPIDGIWVKVCKYYRSMRRQCYAGCTYVGFIGFDLCLGDQCKMCGKNEGKYWDDED